jgi:hypothetical protein
MKRFTCEDLLYSNPTVSLHSWMQSGAQALIMTSDQCLFCLFMDDENKLVVVDINDYNKNNPEMMIVLLSCVPRFAHLSLSIFCTLETVKVVLFPGVTPPLCHRPFQSI